MDINTSGIDKSILKHVSIRYTITSVNNLASFYTNKDRMTCITAAIVLTSWDNKLQVRSPWCSIYTSISQGINATWNEIQIHCNSPWPLSLALNTTKTYFRRGIRVREYIISERAPRTSSGSCIPRGNVLWKTYKGDVPKSP